ncbi:hypothetical protein M378DRAFT_373504 [Amanita muscaria Koide BX008]|uniref:Uncharacterized protein n=1 Tax=Amanita muscaria (strain Koide BX008) TaxID=946122 RepID=A0A0C2TI77_AMAMK|nr:hypothetical protein M378DRAFT_373504 [Amanita muscaria Koide BX008]
MMVSRTLFVALAAVCTALQGAVAFPDAIGNDPAMLTKRVSSPEYCLASCNVYYRYRVGTPGYALCMRRCSGYYP